MKDKFIAILISFIIFFEIMIGAGTCGTGEMMMTYWKEVILPTLVIAAIYFGRR